MAQGTGELFHSVLRKSRSDNGAERSDRSLGRSGEEWGGAARAGPCKHSGAGLAEELSASERMESWARRFEIKGG